VLVELLFGNTLLLISHGSQFEDNFFLGCHFCSRSSIW
jgi:hypothetical protein